METLTDVFENCIDEYIVRYSKDNNQLLFFQGFPLEFYKVLGKKMPHFCNNNVDDYLDYRNINPSNLLQGLLSTKGLCWGYYEEFLGLSSTLNDFSVYNGELHIVTNNLFADYYPIPVKITKKEATDLYANESTNLKEHPILSFYSDIRIDNGIIYFSYINKHYDIDIHVNIEQEDLLNLREEIT